MSSMSFMDVCKEFEKLLGKDWQVDELSQDLYSGLTAEQIQRLLEYKSLLSSEGRLKEGKLERFKTDMLTEKQVDMMINILKDKGIEPVIRETNKGRLAFCVDDEVVFGVGILPNGSISYTIFDRSIYDKYFADDENATFCFVSRTNSNDYKVRCFVEGYRDGIELHQLVLIEKGVNLIGSNVDHKSCNAQLNISDMLRKANNSQNKRNSKFLGYGLKNKLKKDLKEGDYNRHKGDCARQVEEEQREGGEFAYDPLNDFSNTWYAFVLHKMLNRGTEEDLKDYNRDFIFNHDKVTQIYYESIL
ncbi:MAG: hypothetical protein K2H52_11310 [Lachnospiraceae bacterium]|nr:hypothetical protein [Lachnospiraceae bacterium]